MSSWESHAVHEETKEEKKWLYVKKKEKQTITFSVERKLSLELRVSPQTGRISCHISKYRSKSLKVGNFFPNSGVQFAVELNQYEIF